MATVYQATCDELDNHETGFYGSADEALAAFWLENVFSQREREQVQPYVRQCESEDPLVREAAAHLAASGSPSPALGIEL